MVLGLSVLLALEWTRLVVRRTFVCVLSDGRTFPVGRKNFSCRKEELFLSEGRTFPVGKKNFSCRKEKLFLSERKIFPVGKKNFSCRKEKFFLKVGQKVLNFRKFEWFTDGQLEKFFLSEGKFFPVGRKIFSCWKEKLFLLEGNFFPVGRKFFSCRKEGLGMPEGFDKTIYLIELPEPSLVSSLKNKWFIYSSSLKLSKYSVIFSFSSGKSSLNVSIVQPFIS